MNKVNVKEVLKYRNVWLGCAMIWIVWYHLKINSTISVLNYIKGIGYGGVDICLFASGVGCYFSLCKDANVYNFMTRRFLRLMPTYWCFIIIWIVFKVATEKITVQVILGNFLGIQYFTGLGECFNWYISAIILFYILAPLLMGIVQKISKIQNHILIIFLFVLMSIPFWNSNTYIITVTRIPIFYIGMLFAKFCISDRKLTTKLFFFLFSSFIVGLIVLGVFWTRYNSLLWSRGLFWYPFILITPGLCVIISCTMHLLGKYKWGSVFVRMLDKIGQYSFEIYLVHIFVFDLVKYMISSVEVLPDVPLVWGGAVVFVIACCIVLRFSVTLLQKGITDLCIKFR